MSLGTVLLVVVIAGFVIAKRMQGEVIKPKRVLILPLVLIAIGASNFHGADPDPSVLDLTLGGFGAGIGLLLGAVRGLTIHVFTRNGLPWSRYRVTTVLVWLLSLAFRVLFTLAGHLVGASAALGSDSLLLFLGLSLLGEGAVIALRVTSAGHSMALSR